MKRLIRVLYGRAIRKHPRSNFTSPVASTPGFGAQGSLHWLAVLCLWSHDHESPDKQVDFFATRPSIFPSGGRKANEYQTPSLMILKCPYACSLAQSIFRLSQHASSRDTFSNPLPTHIPHLPSLIPNIINIKLPHAQPRFSNVVLASFELIPLTPNALTCVPFLSLCSPTATFQLSSSVRTKTYLLPSWSRMLARKMCSFVLFSSPVCRSRNLLEVLLGDEDAE